MERDLTCLLAKDSLISFQSSPKMTDYNQSGQNGKTDQLRTPKRLILCFDGTGNTFQGNTGDTNIVKLLNMFERSSPDQMHYYQRK